MSFLSLLAALALGYYRPQRANLLRPLFAPYAGVLEHNFNDGRKQHGVIAWLLAVLVPVLLIGIAYFFLHRFNHWLGAVLSAALLYCVLGIGKFGSTQEAIAARLRDHNLDEARALLATWQDKETRNYSESQISRVGIEATLQNAHHDLFAPIFWFVFLGPVGALLYRLSYLLKLEWAGKHDGFDAFALQAFEILDWLPARFTAASFAIVGDFEDAVYCWRTQAAAWPNEAQGIILASGAGALGVRLGEALPGNGVLEYRPEIGMGDEADADYLQSATGLIWRVLVVMVGLLLLLTFAHWLGN